MAVTMTITEYKDFLTKKLKEASSIEKEIDEEIKNKYIKDLNAVIKGSIDKFYHSYKPKYYKRKYSLRDMYEILPKQGGFTIDFDPSYTEKEHRLDNDKLYDLVFMEGYHGGAPYIAPGKVEKWGKHPSPGTPYWRTPYPDFTEWGMAAFKSKSPFEIVQDDIKAYEAKADSILDKLIRDKIRKWIR